MRRLTMLGVAVLVIGLVSPVAAQGPKLTIGPVAGLNFATWGGSDASGISSRTSFMGGGFLTVQLGGLFWFRPEVLFSQKGWKESDQGATVTFKTDYVEVPLLLGLTVPVQGSGIRPMIYAGPSVSFNMNCKLTGEQGGTSVDVQCDDPLFEQALGETIKMKGVDFGILFGGGLGFPVGPGELAVGVRYDLGLVKIVDVTGDPDVKNRVLSVTAEFGFPIGM